MTFDREALNRLYRFAYTLCGDETSAYDLLQDTVERCLAHPPGALVSPEAFARRVMRNRHIDLYRRRQAAPEDLHNDGDVELIAIDVHCLEELIVSRDTLQRIWSLLEPMDREILYYWAVEDMTAAQIASLLGSRRGTILSRIHRLRNRLRDEVDGPIDSPEVLSP